MGIQKTKQPATEPVTVAEAKRQLAVYDDGDDVYIQSLISAAREIIESDLSQTFVETEWLETGSCFPVGRILELARSPLKAVLSIKYDDNDGAEQTVDPSTYTVDTISKPGRVVLKSDGDGWPESANEPNAVRISYTTAYQYIPEDAKHLILLWVAQEFDYRSTIQQMQVRERPHGYDALLHRLSHGGVYA